MVPFPVEDIRKEKGISCVSQTRVDWPKLLNVSKIQRQTYPCVYTINASIFSS